MFFLFLFLATSASALETTSDEMSFDLNKKVCVFDGNCEIKFEFHGDGIFQADHIEIRYKDNDLKKPERIYATKNVFFQNNDVQITSQNCSFDMEILRFSGDVVIENSEIGKVLADDAAYNIKTKRLTISAKNKVKIKVNDDKVNRILKKVKK